MKYVTKQNIKSVGKSALKNVAYGFVFGVILELALVGAEKLAKKINETKNKK